MSSDLEKTKEKAWAEGLVKSSIFRLIVLLSMLGYWIYLRKAYPKMSEWELMLYKWDITICYIVIMIVMVYDMFTDMTSFHTWRKK